MYCFNGCFSVYRGAFDGGACGGFFRAVFGLMVAYGLIFKDRILYVMMIFPMRARTFVYFLAGIEILSVLSSGLGGACSQFSPLGRLSDRLLFLICWKNWHSFSSWIKSKRPHRLHVVRPDSVSGGNKDTGTDFFFF